MLEITGLTKTYGGERGVEDINLNILPGEIYGFIGPNGAGKSTTIRTMLGLIKPDCGSVRIFGKDAFREGAVIRKRLGFVPSDLNYYEGFRVASLLKYSARFYGDGAEGRINEYCEKLRLDLNRRINELSLGNRRKIGVVQALIHKPDLLILDEPTSGLDPLIQSRFYEILREEQARGCTIFFSSHTLSEVERLCDRVAIIRKGRIVNVSRIDELKKMSMKKIRLVPESGLKISEADIPGLSELKTTRDGVEGIFSGNLSHLLQWASELRLDDIVIEDPSLEEIFMHYYNDSEERE